MQGTEDAYAHYHHQHQHHPDYSNPFGDAEATPAPDEPAPATIHPIAIPGNTMSDLSVGAKPVLPGSLAPQFRSIPQKGSSISPAPPASVPSIEKNAPSGTEKDPFADLI